MSEKIPMPMNDNEESDPFFERNMRGLDKLKALSPEAAEIVEQINDPSLSREEFFDAIERFNSLTSGDPVGRYQDVHLEISEKRWATVKMFENGRITLSGSDHNT